MPATPDALAAWCREGVRVRSESHQRWGRPEPEAD